MHSVKALAIELGISPQTVYVLVSEQSVPFYRIGAGRGTIRFDLNEVKQSLKQQQTVPPMQQLPDATHGAGL